MKRSSHLAAAASLAVLACASSETGTAPHPMAVSPASGSPFAETAVAIFGDGFEPEAYQSSGGGAQVDASFRAWLGGAELAGVAWVSSSELRATVPAGLEPGTYRLQVRDPRGGEGSLDAAFTILEAPEIWDDPFGDGTPFAFVFGYDGHVLLGPSQDGSGVVRCLPDGTGCGSFGFLFSRDVTGSATNPDLLTSLAENTVCPTLTTLGSVTTCDPVSPQNTACGCGPDFESGRGLLRAFTIGQEASEWLVAMGRTEKAGQLNYLYMTRDVASPLGFSYVDLYTAMPQTSGVTGVASMAVLNDRLYVGLQVANADRPRIAVLTGTPAPPGLDCTPSDAFATTLQQTSMAESGIGLSQVDAMMGFEGRLFVANRRAVLVSKTGFPTGASDASTQFDDCTPPAAGGWEATSILKYAGKTDLTPADMGVAGLAAWGGRLYIGRNTHPPPPPVTDPAVPELWAFTPRHDPSTGAFLGCLPSDWQRIATNFADPGSSKLTALFASASHLYVGYDNASGAALFRTAVSTPASEADFAGHLSCAAPCTPLGGAGFGDPANTRFLDARAIPFRGVDEVWAVLGSGSTPVRIFRISE
ncbi:MAG TPA: IPT/TIG domain-containing protein [Anaeromyxobacter sp.]